MIGTTLAHYRITAELGAGGMGEVWRAQDTKLGRDVALKVLSEEFADDVERLERFEREARAVAALNHPHIVTIFSVEEADGVRFLTMELIEGRCLDKLISDGGLDLATLLELATPLAEAISAAHAKSVIHRDLKPSNVMVDGEGRVKVLDFGLAKVRDAEGGSESSELPTEALTGVGVLVGTVPYMSPEQIEGKIVDHRTDIFSLGALLYEMATGERPFRGDSQPALMSSILRDVPQSVLEVRNDVPRHLGRIIGRCLEKDRRDRYQTARDVFNELKALRREASSSTGTSAASQPRVEYMAQQSVQPSSDISATDSFSSAAGSVRHDEGFWVAVLPFQSRAADSNVEALAEGLTEDIVTGLSRFSYLRVISRSSTSRYAGEAVDVRTVGTELGARYVMEGSIRQAGAVLRIAAQLVDTETGAHLWAETYNRPFSPEEVFELQDNLAPRIVSTVADMNGVLPHIMSESIRGRPVDDLSPYEAMLRGFGYYIRLSAEDHAEARACLEKAVAEDPGNADCWALLSVMYAEEHKHGFNVEPDSLDRSLTAARKAVAIAPSNHFAHHSLAQALFFRRELPAFRIAAERAIALNPMDGCTTAFMGILMAYAGQWDEGCALAEKAMQLNAQHPGWYRFSIFLNAYRKKDYSAALDIALKINMPTYFFTHASLASVYGQLGDWEAARQAVRELLAQKPDFAATAREEWGRWVGPGELLEHLVDGLRKAELDVDGAGGDTTDLRFSEEASPIAESGTVGIAVLPFADMSPAKDQDYFCEGMAEEIMNALVRIEGIRVASRTSAFRARQEGHGLPEIARLLSVGHVLEGSVRTGGSRLRVTAQLTDVVSGYQLWSERFDRELEDVFAVQDEIAAGVVEAVEARLAPGARSIPARPQARNLEAYRSYLLGQHLRYAKEDHGGAVRAFQEAVRLEPSHAPSWTGLAESLALSAHMSLIPALEACAAARKALSTALELQGESADGLHGEAFLAFIERRWTALEAAVRRAIELRPSHVPSLGLLGMCLCLHQKPDEAEPFFERARQADPLASFPYMLTALGLLAVRRPQEAHPYAEQALTFEKEDASALFCSSLAKIALGHFEDGIEAAEHGVVVSHRGADFLGLLGWALATAGRKDEARALLEELRARPAAAPPIVSEGWLLGALGEIDAAFEVLVRAENEYQLWLYYTGLPAFDPLRSDPRFDQMLERLGLPPSPSTTSESSLDEKTENGEKSIAVLPFVNMSDDRENEFFSDGLSEEIINALTRIPNLRVIARTSAFRFRGERDLRAVGETLGVRNVLEGSVRRAGDKLRITAQLIDVADDSHIWSERFDREMTDVFEIQDEIADAIVKKLHVSFGSSELVRRQTDSVAAYEALLEGRHHFFQFTPKAAERALVCLQRALSLEPDYPDALMEHGFYHLMMAYMFSDPRDALPHVRALAERALQLDPGHGEAQAAVAVMAVFWDRDWSASEISFRRALELSPASARVHELYGLCCLLGEGRFAEALAELDRAIELDPLSALYAGNRGRVLTCSRKFAEAEESCRRGLAIDPGQLLAQVELIYALLFQDKFDEAIAVGKRAVETHGPVNAPRQALALSHALAGQRDAAMQLVSETAEPAAGYRSPLALGLVHAAFSEMDEAFACLEQSLEERDPLLIYLAVHPMFDTMRDDPRFAALVERLGLPPSPSQQRASSSIEVNEIADASIAVLPLADHSAEQDQAFPTTQQVSAETKSIVVLPFANLSPDPDTEYFSDGLTDEIITDLSRVRALRVISRSSAMRLKGDGRGLAAIGRDLDCQYVLEGSVRRAANTLRMTARLVDAPNDDQLWADKYRGTLDDVFDIQERVSRSIVDALEIRLTPQEAEQLAERPIPDVRAQECYLRARKEIWSFLPGGLDEAISHLEAGLALIGDNALLYQGLGEAYFQSINIGAAGGREEEYITKAESCAEKIFALEPESPRGYSVRAHLQLARGDIHGSGRSWRRVLQAFPKDVQGLQLYAHILGWLGGKPDAAAPLVVRLLDIDPLDPLSRLMSVTVPLFAGRFSEALEPGRRMFDLDPVTPVWRSNYVMALAYNRRFNEAEALTEGVVAQPDSDVGTWWMGLCRAAWREDRAEVLRLADGPYRQAAAWDAEIPWVLASAHAAVGAKDEALHWLDRAIDQGMINYPFLSEYDWFLDSIRGEARFQQSMERARREWERFDV